ncbi:MAG: YbjN domain-containing protein [Coriobacteriales bacterium]|nr:YbjN domain-containing protein [Coriobacteriales bacterium]
MASGAANLIAFETSLEQNGITFEELKNTACPMLRVGYNMQNMDHLDVFFCFDEDGESLHLVTSVIAHVPENKMETGIRAVNAANKHFRWLNFFLDDDNDIIASGDAVLVSDHIGVICHSLLSRTLGICDEAYAGFMHELWAS